MRRCLGGYTMQDMKVLNTQPQTARYWGNIDRTETAACILAAEVEYLTCEAGHYKELLESIKNLCEGTGVGLREDVLDILKKM